MSDLVSPVGVGSQEPVEVRLVVGFKDWIGQAAPKVWFESFHLQLDDARRVQAMVEELVRDNPVDGFPVPRTLDVRTGYTSWGADSSPFLQVALFVAGAMADRAINVGIDKLFARLRSRRQADDWHQPLTREQAIDNARWSVVASYGWAGDTFDSVPRREDELQVVGDSRDVDASTWTITLGDNHDVTYQVTIGEVEGIPSVSRIERIVPS